MGDVKASKGLQNNEILSEDSSSESDLNENNSSTNNNNNNNNNNKSSNTNNNNKRNVSELLAKIKKSRAQNSKANIPPPKPKNDINNDINAPVNPVLSKIMNKINMSKYRGSNNNNSNNIYNNNDNNHNNAEPMENPVLAKLKRKKQQQRMITKGGGNSVLKKITDAKNLQKKLQNPNNFNRPIKSSPNPIGYFAMNKPDLLKKQKIQQKTEPTFAQKKVRSIYA